MQTQDELKAVYVAWKLGAPMEVKHPEKSMHHTHNVWEDHEEYDDYSDFFIQMKLGLVPNTDPEVMCWVNEIEFRIKPKE